MFKPTREEIKTAMKEFEQRGGRIKQLPDERVIVQTIVWPLLSPALVGGWLIAGRFGHESEWLRPASLESEAGYDNES